MKKTKLAIIGCGAVANAHLPVVIESEQADVMAVVDKSLARARELAGQYNVPKAVDDYRKITDEIDAAIVALPHHLHAPISVDLLRQGIHVLIEKPMALTSKECDDMISAARENDTTLAVGQIRRFFSAAGFIKDFLQNNFLGNIISFDYREGTIYSWPVASDFMFRKEAGGGVLADTGAHALDTLLLWFGDYEKTEYYDDAVGGVEADCELYLRMQSGVEGKVELSRTRNLRNTCIIEGEHGKLEIDTQFNPVIRLQRKGQDIELSGQAARGDENEDDVFTFFRRQFADFINAVRDGKTPFVSGAEGRRVVELIEACYEVRQPLKHPWVYTNLAEIGASHTTETRKAVEEQRES